MGLEARDQEVKQEGSAGPGSNACSIKGSLGSLKEDWESREKPAWEKEDDFLFEQVDLSGSALWQEMSSSYKECHREAEDRVRSDTVWNGGISKTP